VIRSYEIARLGVASPVERCRSDELLTLGHFPNAVGTVAFSDDGRRLVGISQDGTLQLFEIKTRQIVATVRDTNRTASPLFAMEDAE